jgi:hypothetical protein
MIINREWIDTVCPEHSRTSCDDDNLNNSCGGWTGYYDRKTGKKEINYPRCSRCYLLNNVGMEIDDLEFIPEVVVYLYYNNKGDRYE